MNYAIHFETLLQVNLVVTPRKKVIKHSLVRVTSGLALCKLGKHEYSIEAGQAFWIPLDCLCSLTFFPNTQIQRVDFSARLCVPFPHQAGYVTLSELSLAAIDKLNQCKQNDEIYTHLLQVLKLEIAQLQPKIELNRLSHDISTWQPHKESHLSAECQMVLRVREAQKRKLSGTKISQIISELFNDDMQQYHQLFSLVLGEKG
ncbi:hypothetical protein [Vibrio aestuarianus]|uniref:hypothetical protein n=1 Tax=Vibrio aestuarianus TaxID=28171 RepID=UPI00237C7C7A|nr:hypothetical protein [Vibrio aestuarianus]MDE1239327.1 hypothetical protein [Vibrio aestuarianus]MDE1251339.1 hypothetical protein [Vibrio aestuarianus]